MTLEPVFQADPFHLQVRSSAPPHMVCERLYGRETYAFLCESLSGHSPQARGGRYSFLGGRPRLRLTAQGGSTVVATADGATTIPDDPFEVLRLLLGGPITGPSIAPFAGGAVGYCAYDAVRYFERLPDTNPDELNAPDVYFIFPEEILVFDHDTGQVDILLYIDESARQERLEQIRAVLTQAQDQAQANVDPPPDPAPNAVSRTPGAVLLTPKTTKADFMAGVRRAQEYIRAGEVFQVVLSQRFEFPVTAPSADLYRALRVTNPSPYMYYLQFEDLRIFGSSPETLVKLEGDKATVRPLAGTRPRGRTPQDDDRLADELRNDEKECAEHVMLVDLGRNDLGRVCRYGTVRTSDLLEIERYARVMHLVSNVQGRLDKRYDAIDLLRATFPAGTVSGAPKVRAMQIIDEIETVRRSVYAGALGYFGLGGDMDMCIAIRTIFLKGRRGYVQAGAGIVADSVPEREYHETLHKAQALMQAVQRAKGAA